MYSSIKFSVIGWCVLISVLSVTGHDCQSPQLISTSYTTQDATVLKHVAYISSFYVKCKRGESGNLYALSGDTISPVASVGPGKYQLSWTEDIKTAKTGDLTLNIYNENGYAGIRKALRAGEDISTVPIFSQIKINHPGIYVGPWFSCECLAVSLAVVMAYIAVHFRTKLLN